MEAERPPVPPFTTTESAVLKSALPKMPGTVAIPSEYRWATRQIAAGEIAQNLSRVAIRFRHSSLGSGLASSTIG